MSKLSLKEIAKLVRTEIANKIKTGDLPKGLKVSVRTNHYSMGCSLNTFVTAVPDGFAINNAVAAAWRIANPHGDFWDMPEEVRTGRFSPEGQELLAKLDAIVSEYHESKRYDPPNDDIVSENFHKRIDWDWRIEHADRERIEAQVLAVAAAAEAEPSAPAPAEKPRYRVLADCTPVLEAL